MPGLDLILGQNMRKKSSWKSVAAPDTDSNIINLTPQGTNVTPDLEFSHNYLRYVSPVGNVQTVTINSPIRWEDRSLQILILDNSNNSAPKTFNFSGAYDFLDDTGVFSYTLSGGSVRVWYGAVFNGRICFRTSVETSII